MRCLTPQPDGTLLLQPVGAACVSTDLVALTQEEGAKALLNPLNLSVEEGFQVGGAVMLVWATAWVFRAVIRSLDVGSVNHREYED